MIHTIQNAYCSVQISEVGTKPGAHYVCMEPWYSHNDFAESNQDITQKEGITKLSANAAFNTGYRIEI